MGQCKFDQRFVDSLSKKIDLLFHHRNPGPIRPIIKYIRRQNTLHVTDASNRGLTLNHDNHENGSTIDVFLNFCVPTKIIGRNGDDKQCGRDFLFK